ncbi:type II toxin-antitoxin system TacA family antitoxin [Cellulomonas composti]|uniref:DUF1778 domain-containing protein n=1 Tax=Cellulomonas composti TaxID=266130 RepID=A0A511J845_9CELL|nr:DUF1778 domain-containing protein [Cellulomonas composti]GEL93889.1 hypothetical protein CCO02nite_05470 [Cellulomonas composti]
MATATKTSRLNLRVAPESLDVLRRAAAEQQQDLTSFILGAALDRARETLLEVQVITLTAEERRRLDEAFDREPRVVSALAELVAWAKSLEVEDPSGLGRRTYSWPPPGKLVSAVDED